MKTVKAEGVKIKLSVVVLLAAAFFGAQFSSGRAQTSPQIIISWRAESYAPPAYAGKILPTANSLITASAEVVDGGKAVDLSDQVIYWYVNGLLVSNKPGVQTITFIAPARAPDAVGLRVHVPNYPGNYILKEVVIPIVSPEAVIESPYPGGLFSGTQFRLFGAPYFFNVGDVKNLSFSWLLDGKETMSAESPRELVVNINPDAPAGSALSAALRIDNQKTREGASRLVNLKRTQ